MTITHVYYLYKNLFYISQNTITLFAKVGCLPPRPKKFRLQVVYPPRNQIKTYNMYVYAKKNQEFFPAHVLVMGAGGG